jgi:hypothetical protein
LTAYHGRESSVVAEMPCSSKGELEGGPGGDSAAPKWGITCVGTSVKLAIGCISLGVGTGPTGSAARPSTSLSETFCLPGSPASFSLCNTDHGLVTGRWVPAGRRQRFDARIKIKKHSHSEHPDLPCQQKDLTQLQTEQRNPQPWRQMRSPLLPEMAPAACGRILQEQGGDQAAEPTVVHTRSRCRAHERAREKKPPQSPRSPLSSANNRNAYKRVKFGVLGLADTVSPAGVMFLKVPSISYACSLAPLDPQRNSYIQNKNDNFPRAHRQVSKTKDAHLATVCLHELHFFDKKRAFGDLDVARSACRNTSR